jgi:hypothetical protein
MQDTQDRAAFVRKCFAFADRDRDGESSRQSRHLNSGRDWLVALQSSGSECQ